ncbi:MULTISPECIES: hypothetical protein [unclassified Nostoc]|uniref:hypothetical protein n=1 Tax=unclassified Nostoc TaxID=2593658 RepID=UPI002AD256BA|nr:hypothetical protein [Nostoc sp. DedQUE03]MDZ7971728.1 hypothetical protein [Nostoc sp. DedQUE03]MDZ8047304.1 hypothetical protein [Nostoc sp. DedQUE02]
MTAAEAIATPQGVEGIIAVDLDALHRRDRARSLEQLVAALPARWDAATREIRAIANHNGNLFAGKRCLRRAKPTQFSYFQSVWIANHRSADYRRAILH